MTSAEHAERIKQAPHFGVEAFLPSFLPFSLPLPLLLSLSLPEATLCVNVTGRSKLKSKLIYAHKSGSLNKSGR